MSQSQFIVTETLQADGSVALSRKFGGGPVESLAVDRAGRLRWVALDTGHHEAAGTAHGGARNRAEPAGTSAEGGNSYEVYRRQREAYLSGQKP